MIKELLSKVWTAIKKIKWGWTALFAVYGGVTYFHVLKLFGSTFIGAVVVYGALLVVAKIMKKTA